MNLHEKIDQYVKRCLDFKEEIDPELLHTFFMDDARSKGASALDLAKEHIAQCKKAGTPTDSDTIRALFEGLGQEVKESGDFGDKETEVQAMYSSFLDDAEAKADSALNSAKQHIDQCKSHGIPYDSGTIVTFFKSFG